MMAGGEAIVRFAASVERLREYDVALLEWQGEGRYQVFALD